MAQAVRVRTMTSAMEKMDDAIFFMMFPPFILVD